MPSRQKLIFALVVLLIAALTGLGALWLTRGPGGPISLGEALVGGPFTLTDKNGKRVTDQDRSEEHTSELQSLRHLVCRLLLEKKKLQNQTRLMPNQPY